MLEFAPRLCEDVQKKYSQFGHMALKALYTVLLSLLNFPNVLINCMFLSVIFDGSPLTLVYCLPSSFGQLISE